MTDNWIPPDFPITICPPGEDAGVAQRMSATAF
jgi:hypothetical protein